MNDWVFYLATAIGLLALGVWHYLTHEALGRMRRDMNSAQALLGVLKDSRDAAVQRFRDLESKLEAFRLGTGEQLKAQYEAIAGVVHDFNQHVGHAPKRRKAKR